MAGIFKTEGLWSCGFDFLPDGTLVAGGVFDVIGGSPQIGSSFARFAGKGVRMNGNNIYAGRTLQTNLASYYEGFAFNPIALPTSTVLHVFYTAYDTNAGQAQFSLAVNSQGQIGFYSGSGFGGSGSLALIAGTSLSATGILVPGGYYFIEVFATISATVGVFTLKVNEVTVLTFSGLNNRTTANAWVNQVSHGALSSSGDASDHRFDDIYILDTTAPAPLNTFLGNGRIQTDGPTGDSATGGLNQWAHTTPQGTDWGNAANIPANPAQYDSDSTLNDRMSLSYPAITATKVLFLNAWISAQQDAAGSRQITPIYRSNSVDQNGTAISLSNGVYVYSNQASAVDPNTAAPWASGTVAAAQGCEIGVKVTT